MASYVEIMSLKKKTLLLDNFRHVSLSGRNNIKMIRLTFKRLAIILLIYFLRRQIKIPF